MLSGFARRGREGGWERFAAFITPSDAGAVLLLSFLLPGLFFSCSII